MAFKIGVDGGYMAHDDAGTQDRGANPKSSGNPHNYRGVIFLVKFSPSKWR